MDIKKIDKGWKVSTSKSITFNWHVNIAIWLVRMKKKG